MPPTFKFAQTSRLVDVDGRLIDVICFTATADLKKEVDEQPKPKSRQKRKGECRLQPTHARGFYASDKKDTKIPTQQVKTSIRCTQNQGFPQFIGFGQISYRWRVAHHCAFTGAMRSDISVLAAIRRLEPHVAWNHTHRLVL
jgi:hypothetical protein